MISSVSPSVQYYSTLSSLSGQANELRQAVNQGGADAQIRQNSKNTVHNQQVQVNRLADRQQRGQAIDTFA